MIGATFNSSGSIWVFLSQFLQLFHYVTGGCIGAPTSRTGTWPACPRSLQGSEILNGVLVSLAAAWKLSFTHGN